MRLGANHILTNLSITIILYLLGLYMVMSFQSQLFIEHLKEGVDLIIELDDRVDEETITQLKNFLTESDYTLPTSIQYFSKDQVREEVKEMFGEDAFIEDIEAPIFSLLTFRVRHKYYNESSLSIIQDEILKKEHVTSFFYHSDIFSDISQNFKKFGLGILIVGGFLFVITLALISSTLKLQLYTKRKIIKTMDLVGARSSFVKRPFIWSSLFNGIVSSFLAIGLLWVTIYVGSKYFSPLGELLYTRFTMYVFIFIFLVGTFFSVLVTIILLGRFLKMRIEEMY